jgi:hypothetical protein
MSEEKIEKDLNEVKEEREKIVAELDAIRKELAEVIFLTNLALNEN